MKFLKSILLVLIMAFFCVNLSYAQKQNKTESLCGLKLGSSIENAITVLGEFTDEQNIENSITRYVWSSDERKIYIRVKNEKIISIHVVGDIGGEKSLKDCGTSKGIYLGDIGEKKTIKYYGKPGKVEYSGETGDCFIFTYNISSTEKLLFRWYGFNQRGAIIIDIALFRPGVKDIFQEWFE